MNRNVFGVSTIVGQQQAFRPPPTITESMYHANTQTPLASISNWSEGVTNAYPCTRHEMEIGVPRHKYGDSVYISFKPLQDTQTPTMQKNPAFQPLFLTRITLQCIVPAIRHYSEPMWKINTVCQEGCKDIRKCKHTYKLKDPVYYTNCLGHLIPKRTALEIGAGQGQSISQTAFRTTYYQQEVVDDLSVPRMQNSDEEVGRFYSEGDQLDWSKSEPELSVLCTLLLPPFQQASMGLPLLLFHMSPLALRVDLCSLQDAYHSNDRSVPYLLYENRPLKDSDIRMRCLVEVQQTHDLRLCNPNLSLPTASYYSPYLRITTGLLKLSKEKEGEGTISVDVLNEVLEILWIVIPQSWSEVEQKYMSLDPTRNPFNWTGPGGEDVFSEAEISAGTSSPRQHARRQVL